MKKEYYFKNFIAKLDNPSVEGETLYQIAYSGMPYALSLEAGKEPLIQDLIGWCELKLNFIRHDDPCFYQSLCKIIDDYNHEQFCATVAA